MKLHPNLTGPKTSPPDSPELARRKIESIAGLVGVTVLPVRWETTRGSLELCERYGVRRQRYFDLQVVALMLTHRIGTLITENVADFAAVDGIRVVNPFEAPGGCHPRVRRDSRGIDQGRARLRVRAFVVVRRLAAGVPT